LMDEAGQTAALAKLELTDLWGLAVRIAARLQAIGISTPLQLRDADPKWIRSQFSVVMERMVLELQGIPCLQLEDGTPDRQSIMSSKSFGRPWKRSPKCRRRWPPTSAARPRRCAGSTWSPLPCRCSSTPTGSASRTPVLRAAHGAPAGGDGRHGPADPRGPTTALPASGNRGCGIRKPGSFASTCTRPPVSKLGYSTRRTRRCARS